MNTLIEINQVKPNGKRREIKSKVLVAVGPNLSGGNKRWAARRASETGEHNLPQDAIFLKDVTIVASDKFEGSVGCVSRAGGYFTPLNKFPKEKLVPVTFDKYVGFYLENGPRVDLSHLALLPDGRTLGVVAE